jgi:hypothetical protein
LEDKLRDNKMRCYRHVLRMNKERIQNKVLNMRVKGKCPRDWTLIPCSGIILAEKNTLTLIPITNLKT